MKPTIERLTTQMILAEDIVLKVLSEDYLDKIVKDGLFRNLHDFLRGNYNDLPISIMQGEIDPRDGSRPYRLSMTIIDGEELQRLKDIERQYNALINLKLMNSRV